MKRMNGAAGSPGIARGPLFVMAEADLTMPDFDDPKQAFAKAVSRVAGDLAALRDEAAEAGRQEASDVLGAQALMAEDPMIADAVTEKLDAGEPLGDALAAASAEISGTLAALEDEYLAARAADVTEVADRIAKSLAGVELAGLDAMNERAVVVAPALTAADTARMDPDMVAGFVTDHGGPTGHVAVIARSLGIPAVVAAAGATDAATEATNVVLDGSTGEVIFDPDDDAEADFARRAEVFASGEALAAQYEGVRVSFGEAPMRIAANVGNADDVTAAVSSGADGVGLYRTEFLFLDRSEPPGEDEQYEAYVTAARAFDDPVVIRTLDIGGDKPAPYLDIPVEENPFLGERAVRLYERFDDVFRTQARALLRAAAEGDVWIMVPMIATMADWESAKRGIDAARAELLEAGVEAGDPKLGVMIEVPSAALIATHLAKSVDFFSIGTNDLTQYVMAADRTHGALHRYADAAHPAILALCSATATAATNAGISVAVCGEAGSDPVTALLYAAMGMDKLSVSPRAVGRVKAAIATTDPAAAASALGAALGAGSADEVRQIVAPLIAAPG